MKIGSIVNDSNNMHCGSGPLSINSVHVGYIKDAVDVENRLESLIVKSGTPQRQVAQIPLEFILSLKASLMEITPQNYVFAVGVENSAITVWDGVSDEYDTYWTTTVDDQQLLTFRTRGWGELESIRLDHKNVKITGGEHPVISSTDGVTAYSSVDDYLLDSARGIIWAKPSGSIPAGGQAYCKYKCIPPAGSEIALNSTNLISSEHPLSFIAVDADTQKAKRFFFPRSAVTAGGITTSGSDLWLLNVTIEALKSEDITYAAHPLGYVEFDVMDTYSA